MPSIIAPPELTELLADLAHRQWSGWTRWMIDKFSPEMVERWERQIKTPYSELSEQEKDSDRNEARKLLRFLHAAGYGITKKKQEDCMIKLKHDLLTDKYTTVYHEPPNEMNYNAPHRFIVAKSDGNIIPPEPLAEVHFQEGPIKECGVNGVCNEDLIAMVITRLEHFQKSEYSCRENALAITKLEEALLWLRKRTMGREQRGVEGTHVK